MATLQRALHRCLGTKATAHDKRIELMAPLLHRGIGIAAAGDDRSTGMIDGVAACQKSTFDRRNTWTIAEFGKSPQIPRLETTATIPKALSSTKRIIADGNDYQVG